MLRLSVAARMKKSHHCVRVRINSGEIGSLVRIALMASPCQVFPIIRAAMLAGEDVLDVERMKAVVFLVQPASRSTVVRQSPFSAVL